jgi:cellulose synthase/poly-beta-1,6-N-acetylglucosamine synthase-like glycosyltransferase
MISALVPFALFEIGSSGLRGWMEDLVAGVLPSVYQISSFDWVLVGLYLATMVVLSCYGLHRYQLVYLYHKHKRNTPGEPEGRFEKLPRVTVQLPIYNEQYVVEQLLESICRLDYPRDLLQIQLLDDSTDETQQVARAACRRLAGLGHPVEYLHRNHRRGYKAGALQAGLATARGELIAIFDADFSPDADFLSKTIHYFTDPKVGMVQGRWTYRNRDHSLLTRIQAILLDGHFVFEHGARSRSGRFFNFNGTAGVLRRTTIEDAGGWQFETLTEDTDLSYRAQLRGWKFLYLPQLEVPSELPVDMTSFQAQQARWAKGLIQTAKKILPVLLRSNLPLKVKAEACFHLTGNISYPLMVVLSILLLPAIVVRYYHWSGQLLYLDIPLFLGTFSSLSTFYVLSQKELYPRRWRRAVLMLPALMAVGIGLTLTNARAVMEALLGIASPFQRTAKYSTDQSRAQLARGKYRVRGGWLPTAHLAAGSYFGFCILCCLLIGNWATMPFLMVFVMGYYFTGVLMLVQSRQSRLASREQGLLE